MKKRAWVILTIILAVLITILVIYLTYKDKIEYMCTKDSQCKPYYSCCGGWTCQREGALYADCMMYCDKPPIEEAINCACNDFKCGEGRR
jgi:hypothetical protein